MHEFVSFKDQIILSAEADIPAVSSAALYGKGVFTTIAIRDGKPFLWEKHWERLTSDAERLNLDISGYTDADVANALAYLIAKNDVEMGRARVTFLDESSGGAWHVPGERGTTLLIVTGDAYPAPENLRLTVSPYILNSRSPLAGIKSCNYLENLLAYEETKNRGFDEAIRLNERGGIASACMANVFWEKDGRVFTPALATGCLAGTVRQLVIEKYGAVETIAGIEALTDAEAIFLTSSGLGVVSAAEFDGRKFETTAYHIENVLGGNGL